MVYITCTASSCDKIIPDRVSSFWVQNNSSEAISFSYSLKYPDTLLYKEMIIVSPRPGQQNRIPIDNRKDWAKVINEDIPGKKLQIFVFTIPVNDNNWDSVRSNYLVQKRYELSVDDLNAMKWVVAFP